MSHNWHNYNKKIKLSDAKNTRKMDACFSKQISSETLELDVKEQSEIRSSSSNVVINFVEQSKSRHHHQHPLPKVNLLVLPSLKRDFNYVYLHYV